MADTSAPRPAGLTALWHRIVPRALVAALADWSTAQDQADQSICADLDRRNRDLFLLHQTGLTRGDVTRMHDRARR